MSSRSVRPIQLVLRSIVPFVLLVMLSAPSLAWACGVYIPREGDGYVAQERALIRWDGRLEDIVMELGVTGEASEAAWIVPVPNPADARLADPEIFTVLQRLTIPLERPSYTLFPEIMLGAGETEGVGAAPVTVLSRQRLSAFDVAGLAATDAVALSTWLAENGFPFPPEMEQAMQPYVDLGWYYVAIRIAPEALAEGLSGRLEPLWLTFEADELVYPMRPSSLSPEHFTVFLYVLADHRVEPSAVLNPNAVTFADWVAPEDLSIDSPLAPLLDRPLFLTKFEETVWDPATITDDYRFRLAAEDTVFRQIDYYERWLWEVCLAACCLPLLLLIGVLVFVLLRRQKGNPVA